MRKRNVWTALAAAAMVMQLVAVASPSAAQATPEVSFTFTPTSGPAGTKINITGSGCPHSATAAFDGIAFLTAQGSQTPISSTQVQFTSTAQGTYTPQLDTTGLAPGQYVPWVACATTNKAGPGSLFTVTVPVIPGSTYFPLSPARVLDTRTGLGVGGAINKIGAGGKIDVVVTGLLGVPAANVTAVALCGHPEPVMLILVPAGPEVGVKLKTTSGGVCPADGPAVATSCITIAAAANAVQTFRFLMHLSLSSQGPRR